VAFYFLAGKFLIACINIKTLQKKYPPGVKLPGGYFAK
jgi:hypothetical protein